MIDLKCIQFLFFVFKLSFAFQTNKTAKTSGDNYKLL